MSHEGLNGNKVGAGIEEIGGKGSAKIVRGRTLDMGGIGAVADP